jgi:dTDP-4-dehydrorhamnose reductase
MSMLVFGQTGQVARALQDQAEVTALGRDRADLRDPAACAQAIADHAPAVVINAAAYTAVDRAEDDEVTATQVNGAAPAAMARACADRGIPFVHISTDYVFDGQGGARWSPNDPTHPQNAYGRSKLAGEQGVRAAGGRFVILRTSWVFSATGTNFVTTMLRLSQTRDALNVVDDQIGGPTPAGDIAATLLVMARALQNGSQGGIYHYAGQPDTSWAGFAREIFARTGRAVTVTGIPTSAYPTPATRPLNSRLDCDTIHGDFGVKPCDWRKGLATVLATQRDSI